MFEEGLEVCALAKALQVPLGRVPLDTGDLPVGLIDAAGRFPVLAVRRGVSRGGGGTNASDVLAASLAAIDVKPC